MRGKWWSQDNDVQHLGNDRTVSQLQLLIYIILSICPGLQQLFCTQYNRFLLTSPISQPESQEIEAFYSIFWVKQAEQLILTMGLNQCMELSIITAKRHIFPMMLEVTEGLVASPLCLYFESSSALWIWVPAADPCICELSCFLTSIFHGMLNLYKKNLRA